MKMKAIWALGTTAVLALAYPVAAQVPSGQAKPRPPAEAAAGPDLRTWNSWEGRGRRNERGRVG